MMDPARQEQQNRLAHGSDEVHAVLGHARDRVDAGEATGVLLVLIGPTGMFTCHSSIPFRHLASAAAGARALAGDVQEAAEYALRGGSTGKLGDEDEDDEDEDAAP